jgi:hypothetical protein
MAFLPFTVVDDSDTVFTVQFNKVHVNALC